MKKIKYLLKDPLGIHARPAGQMVRMAGKFKSDIQLGSTAKMVNAKRIIGVMALTLKQGDEVTLTFSGEDEDEAAAIIGKFLEENL
ncbi:PTS galactitol transporter subunit IIC [Spirochaetia bacterium]|nr:PTS galactitol transporter subunit IIC [Spirochaetia bacterium]